MCSQTYLLLQHNTLNSGRSEVYVEGSKSEQGRMVVLEFKI